MAECVFGIRLVNLRSVTCYTEHNFKENARFGALNLVTSEKVTRRLSTLRTGMLTLSFNILNCVHL